MGLGSLGFWIAVVVAFCVGGWLMEVGERRQGSEAARPLGGAFINLAGILLAALALGSGLGVGGKAAFEALDVGQGTQLDSQEQPQQSSRSKACHPSYAGACLDPDASDYDCRSGEGDGPKYVSGPIRVTGSDPFDLDREGDGVACEDG